MHEPDVALTDYLLAAECLAFVLLLARRPAVNAVAHRALVGLFASLAATAALGGTYHGFLQNGGAISGIVWLGMLLAVGAAAWNGWALVAWTTFGPRPARTVTAAAGVIFCAYAFYVAACDRAYGIAVLHYIPASLALAAAFLVRAVQSRAHLPWVGFAGVVLTFVAAGVQQAGLGLHPRYLSHNAVYHLIQMVALLLVYKGARWICAQPVLAASRTASHAS